MLIESVTIGAWSSKAGVNEGDEILQMNYVKIGQMSKNEIINNVTQVRPLVLHMRKGPEKKLGTPGFLRRNLGAGRFVCQAVAQDYDLVLANGRVIDPETGLDAVRHVGIRDGEIVAVSETPLDGDTVRDVTGRIATG